MYGAYGATFSFVPV